MEECNCIRSGPWGSWRSGAARGYLRTCASIGQVRSRAERYLVAICPLTHYPAARNAALHESCLDARYSRTHRMHLHMASICPGWADTRRPRRRRRRFPGPVKSLIHAWFVPGRRGAGAVLLLHGVRANRRIMLGRARFLHDSGYALLIPDFQAHGENRTLHNVRSAQKRPTTLPRRYSSCASTAEGADRR